MRRRVGLLFRAALASSSLAVLLARWGQESGAYWMMGWH